MLNNIGLLIHPQYIIHDNFLIKHCNENIPTRIYLKNGIALEGYIEGFDKTSVILKNRVNQLIYKSSIATIMPIYEIKKIKSLELSCAEDA